MLVPQLASYSVQDIPRRWQTTIGGRLPIEEVTTIARGAIMVQSFSSQVSTAHQPAEEEDHDRRSQRRRYEEPPHLKLRRQMLAIAESVCMSLLGSSPTANAFEAVEEDR